MQNKIFSDDVLHNLFVRFLWIMTKQAFICTKIILHCFFHKGAILFYISNEEIRGVPFGTPLLINIILFYLDIREPDAETGPEGDAH